MSRQPLIHRTAGQSTQSASGRTARTRLFVVDVDRKKRIDDSIDYFGHGSVRRVVVIADPCGEALLDADRVLRERGGATVVHHHRPDRATKVRSRAGSLQRSFEL